MYTPTNDWKQKMQNQALAHVRSCEPTDRCGPAPTSRQPADYYASYTSILLHLCGVFACIGLFAAGQPIAGIAAFYAAEVSTLGLARAQS